MTRTVERPFEAPPSTASMIDWHRSPRHRSVASDKDEDVELESHPIASRQARSASPPKLVQWSKEAVHYYEGSTLVLSCSLAISAPTGSGPLRFSWFKQGKPLGGSQTSQQNQRLSIETLPDYSFLRLNDLRSTDSGAYTCAVTNSLGLEDRTTSQVVVNG